MDPDNIFQILVGNSPADAGPTNVLQQMAPPAPSPVMAAADAASPPVPQKRRSLLDTIGRISDVIATVGGAAPLYQPTLDARQDRTLALGDHERKVLADNVALATNKFALGDSQNTRLGQVARGLQAIKASGGDINQAWPVLAQRMQIDPTTIDSVGKALASDPTALDGLVAATTDPKYDQSKYSGNVVYGTDASGKLVAYQPSMGNDAARNVLPEGITPVDPLKFVDLGGSQAGVGSRTGRTMRILPKTEAPGRALDRQERIREFNQTDATRRYGIDNRPGGKGTTGSADMGTANMLLDNIARGFDDLHGMQALPGEGSAVGQVAGAIGRSAIGQKIGEQTGNAAAQKRLEIEKDINSLQSEMVKSLPASATRTKFEQEIQRRRMPDPSRMSYGTSQRVIADLRSMFAQAQKDAAAELARKAPTTVRPKPQSGWTIVGVK